MRSTATAAIIALAITATTFSDDGEYRRSALDEVPSEVVLFHQVGWRRNPGPQAPGVVWLTFARSTHYVELLDAEELAAIDAVFSSGLPVHYRQSANHFSTDPRFAYPGDYEVGTVTDEIVPIVWHQLSWSLTRSKGQDRGVILLHVDDAARSHVFLTTDSPAEFVALARILRGLTPAFFRPATSTILTNRYSDHWR